MSKVDVASQNDTSPGTSVVARAFIQSQGFIETSSRGSSMLPYLHEGDILGFVPIQPGQVKPGDVVLFSSDSGSLIGHRVVKIVQDGKNRMCLCKGDNNDFFDGAMQEQDLIGKLEYFTRDGRVVPTASWRRRFWTFTVIRFPLYSRLLRIYEQWKRRIQRLMAKVAGG